MELEREPSIPIEAWGFYSQRVLREGRVLTPCSWRVVREEQGGWLLVTTGSQHVLPVSFWQQIWGAARPQGIWLGLWGLLSDFCNTHIHSVPLLLMMPVARATPVCHLNCARHLGGSLERHFKSNTIFCTFRVTLGSFSLVNNLKGTMAYINTNPWHSEDEMRG